MQALCSWSQNVLAALIHQLDNVVDVRLFVEVNNLPSGILEMCVYVCACKNIFVCLCVGDALQYQCWRE